MLILAKGLQHLNFGKLMAVYGESNLEKGKENWPEEPEMRQIALAEADFFDYLSQIFFADPKAFYAIWMENGTYVSALRLEPFRDGLLLAGLETMPGCRRRGYATRLMEAVLVQVEGKVYSHVAKGNAASLQTHEKCGFRKVADHAAYSDGSVDQKSVTLCWER